MNKNKKSIFIGVGALMMLIVSIVLFVVIIKSTGHISNFLFGSSGDKYMQDFIKFVEDINNQRSGTSPPNLIKLKENSAIVGFTKNSDSFECIDCYSDKTSHIIVEKPPNPECENNACICLCVEEFQLVDTTYKFESIKESFCPKFECEELEPDIASNVAIPGDSKGYWKNGFLIVNNVPGANGLKSFNPQIDHIIVEKRQNIMGVCTREMIEYNRNELGFDKCIITIYDKAKKLEEEDKLDEAKEKYLEFIEMHESGREVEESLFRVGEIFMKLGKYQEAANTFFKLINEHPNSIYQIRSTNNLNELKLNYQISIPVTIEEDKIET